MCKFIRIIPFIPNKNPIEWNTIIIPTIQRRNWEAKQCDVSNVTQLAVHDSRAGVGKIL